MSSLHSATFASCWTCFPEEEEEPEVLACRKDIVCCLDLLLAARPGSSVFWRGNVVVVVGLLIREEKLLVYWASPAALRALLTRNLAPVDRKTREEEGHGTGPVRDVSFEAQLTSCLKLPQPWLRRKEAKDMTRRMLTLTNERFLSLSRHRERECVCV